MNQDQPVNQAQSTNPPVNSLDRILQELVQEAPANTLANNSLLNQCNCHYIDPRIHRVLLWVKINPNTGVQEYTLRIGSQRFLGLPTTDRNGTTYWRFQALTIYNNNSNNSTK